MAVDRHLWKPVWQDQEYPTLPCPSCDARLNFDAESLDVKVSNYNRHVAEVAGVDEAVARFSGRFHCGNGGCGDIVTVSGDCHYEYGYDERGATITQELLHPKALHPGPPIIRIGESVPDDIRTALTRSFALFWSDYDACASKLRATLELILKHYGVEGTDAKGRFMPLHQRILKYRDTGGEDTVATSLMAVKWLGNVSAHESSLRQDAVLDGYDILELTLNKLFPADTSGVEDLAERVNRAKGPAR
jgi:hypothetical protein